MSVRPRDRPLTTGTALVDSSDFETPARLSIDSARRLGLERQLALRVGRDGAGAAEDRDARARHGLPFLVDDAIPRRVERKG